MPTKFLGAILFYKRPDGSIFGLVPDPETTDAVFFNSQGRDLYYRALQFCGKVQGDLAPYRIPFPNRTPDASSLEELYNRVLEYDGTANGDGCIHCDSCMWWCPNEDAREPRDLEDSCIEDPDIYYLGRSPS